MDSLKGERRLPDKLKLELQRVSNAPFGNADGVFVGVQAFSLSGKLRNLGSKRRVRYHRPF